MTNQEFEKVYERLRESAIRQAMAMCRIGRAAAEDAVQNAAIYCLENIERFKRITPSYFSTLVVNRARNISQSENARVVNREHGVGDWFDLADIEEADAAARLGRTKPAPGADNIDNPAGSYGGRQ